MGGTEELLEIEAPWWATPSRRVQAIALIICVLLVAGAIATIAQRARSHHASASTRPASVGLRTDTAIEHVAVRCPVGDVCRVSGTVPDATSAAISDALPGGFERAHYSVVRSNPDALFYRSVNSTVGLVELLVIVSTAPSDHLKGFAAMSFPGATIGYVREYRLGFEIQVQYTGPPGYQPPMTLAHRIAADPRLLVVG